jgi:SAM-dependent methyltransferase
MMQPYVHGYKSQETDRLRDQAATLIDLIHAGTAYPAGCRVLEVGCGVGAQTVVLSERSPEARITSIDTSRASLEVARHNTAAAGIANVEFLHADVHALPFGARSFDHVFVCFVLEHLVAPVDALLALWRLLKPGGTITVIEGDHGSAIFHPEDAAARDAIRCLVDLQRLAGGNALIGRELHPLMTAAGFAQVVIEPRMAYADPSRPQWVDGFTRKTFIAMIEGARPEAIGLGLIDAARFDDGLCGLNRTTLADGMFGYTFFKAVACRSS